MQVAWSFAASAKERGINQDGIYNQFPAGIVRVDLEAGLPVILEDKPGRDFDSFGCSFLVQQLVLPPHRAPFNVGYQLSGFINFRRSAALNPSAIRFASTRGLRQIVFEARLITYKPGQFRDKPDDTSLLPNAGTPVRQRLGSLPTK